jgi:hypothetical protein
MTAHLIAAASRAICSPLGNGRGLRITADGIQVLDATLPEADIRLPLTDAEAESFVLSRLSHAAQVSAILTASPAAIKSAMGKLARACRSDAPAAPKVLRPCPHCGQSFGAREMRKHKPRCKLNLPSNQ